MKEVEIKLSNLYKKIINKKLDFSKVDKEKYYKEFVKNIKLNPIFDKLSKKYMLTDISLDKDLIFNKYLYIYIFFEKLYEEIKYSKKLKTKIFQLNYPIKLDNIFINIKRYTLYYGVKLAELCNKFGIQGKMYKNITFHLAISINILEAIITDLIHLEIDNSIIGLILIFTLPFSNKYIDNTKRFFTKEWINLYTSWNYNFIYNNGPSNNCFPTAGICLINSYKYNIDNLWIDNRLYTLYLTTTLLNNKLFIVDKKINNNFLQDWNKLNDKYVDKLLFKNKNNNLL